MEEIFKDFIIETNAGLLAVEQQMLQLEKEPENLELVNDIFLVMHTIKGTCGFLGLNRLQQIAHSSENIFSKVRDQALDIDEDTLSILFEAIERIKVIVDDLSKGKPEGAEDVDEILKLRLDTCARKQKSVAQTFMDRKPAPAVEQNEEQVLEESLVEEETPVTVSELQYVQPIDTVVFAPESAVVNDIQVDDNSANIVESLEEPQYEQAIQPELLVTEPVVNHESSTLVDVDAILNFIFSPLFSKAQTISSMSGCGVDMVKANIEKIGGIISVDSSTEFGAVFNIKIPVTFTIFSSVIFGCGNLKMAIPQTAVSEIILVSKRYNQTIEYVNALPVLRLRNGLLPLIILSEILSEPQISNQTFVVCINFNDFSFGLVVDKIFDTQEILVQPLAKILSKAELFSGSTILADGSVTLVLDLKKLADHYFNTAYPDCFKGNSLDSN